MPLQATSGAASYDGFGGGVVAEPNYIESCFSTYLYTGNGSTQTITNGIDLTGKGGLTWVKNRTNATDNALFNLPNGGYATIAYQASNATNASITTSPTTSITTTGSGFTLNGSSTVINASSTNYVSWTFRKQPKFFDVVTYTGNGANRTIAHNLGSVPGCIIVKRTDTTADWQVYHRSNANTQYMVLNTTAAVATGTTRWNSTTPTSTVFSLGTDITVNASGGTYVAYLFAHDAGGFGLTGTDNVISCGSFTTAADGSASITLGYEPQWVLVKRTNASDNWVIVDNMRGMPVDGGVGNDQALWPNLSSVEDRHPYFDPSATGFSLPVGGWLAGSSTYIYIVIRRGPMKVPTDGTTVFSPIVSSVATGTAITTNFPVDMQIGKYRAGAAANAVVDRLRGVSTTSTGVGSALSTSSTAAEGTASGGDSLAWGNTGFQMPGNLGGTSDVFWNFRRAPGFFDEICFSGTGANTTQTHNLQKAPELWMVKSRSASTEWVFGSSLLGANEKIVMPSPNGRVTDTTVWNNTYPTSSVLNLGTSSTTNASGATFVGYLMATTAGVSKVGTYTGNGSSQTIDCGFTGGARFVMIIRATASTAQDIYVWDSARGIVAGNDPRLSLNTTAAEVTTLDSVDATSTGFIVNTDASNVNVNGAVYLYWSIA